MPSSHLKHLKTLWGSVCTSMWIEIAALRNLETLLRASHGYVDPASKLVSFVYAPECDARLRDSIAHVLPRLPSVVSDVVTLRLVVIAAAYEAYFESFLEDYLSRRSKYFAAGARTTLGNQVFTQVLQARGPKARLVRFAERTNAGIKGALSHIDAVEEVYVLRNCVAHDAGICDQGTNARVTLVPTTVGKRLAIDPEALATVLAAPCIAAAEQLDLRL